MHVVLLTLLSFVHEPGGLASTREPASVTGGAAALPCAWPSTIAVQTSGGLCTGTLIHPQVVVYAAHCGDAVTHLRVGDHADVAARELDIEACQVNPDYLGVTSQAQDWAYCTLATPVDDLPLTPAAYGCELDAIAAGTEVVIAGFGQDAPGMGAGPKRWALTHIVSSFGATANIGGDGASTCPGDSGGSAMLRLADGSWRAISMVSTGVDCGSAAVHVLMRAAIPWIESSSGIDVTPCHDVDGGWNPGPACAGFYAGDGSEDASWSDACADVPRSAASQSCGPAAPDPGDDTSSSGEGGDELGTSSDADPTATDSSGPGDAGSSGDATGATAPAAHGCAIDRHDATAALPWVVLVAARRRRRPANR
ncbi:MAG: trypsin-like serine protease [Deltaproteobacteria bacterium]|nr:trypsin-like serine protease [Deltaproteobacteria bacterium]